MSESEASPAMSATGLAEKTSADWPLLAFGEASAEMDSDLSSLSDRVAEVVTSLRACEPLGPARAFRQKSASITVNGLKLAAAVSTPMRASVSATDDTTLLIPLAGDFNSLVGGVTHRWRAGESAMFLPAVERVDEASVSSSVLMVDIQPERLDSVAAGMLGLAPDASVEFHLGSHRTVDLSTGGMSFGEVFMHLGGLIDAYRGDPETLAAIGLDDLFYRQMVMLLRPGLMRDEVLRKPSRSQRILDPVCEYIQARLHAPLSLTDLERVSNLSRRSLQYAFWQRHQCSPMQWVRGQRLEKARAILMANDPAQSVTSAAIQCGFANLGAFSGYYRERFGEQPSDTLRRHAPRR